MKDPPDQDVAIFTEALQMPDGERVAFLDRVCGNDSELRTRVEALLKSHSQIGDFLEQSPQGISLPAKPGTSAAEKAGDRIGHFKLLQQIGEGGCGIVFMAEQEEPVRRRVALKVIKPGMDSKSVIARFEAERQALALMDHPNIAKFFDAGATESGRPYFVMELVRGVKITEYCDEHSLTTEERLKLFVQVCKAVQHAHQKGVIHRDIKPSNILVTTTTEGLALPVVIDFGIAKATTNQRLTDKTLFTAFEMLIGTPAYMSPEQADLTSVDVDTRTDIYSLGVLLYELLTGSTPFDAGTLLKAGLDEIRRVIREQEPARPSTRLSKLTGADLTTIAQHRRSEPPTLIHTVRGDLDWIAMKALEKDRARRYETANGLALDIERYLANEPISARPPSTLYKFKKAVLRNKLLFIGIGVIMLLLVVSLIFISASLAKERQSRRVADTASDQSQQVTMFLKEMLNGIGPSVARGRDTAMVRDILDQTAERIGKEMTNHPQVEGDLYSLVGNLYDQIGSYARAEEIERKALTIRRRQFKPESPEVAASLAELGMMLVAEHKLSEAEPVYQEALAIRRKLYGIENADTASSLNDLSGVYRDERRLAEAEAMARQALDIRRKLFGSENLAVADSLRNICIIYGDENKWPDAESTAREVLAMRRRLLGPENPSVAWALDDVAWAANARGEYAEAETLEAQALAMRQKFVTDEHPDTAKTLNALGQVMANQGNLAESHAVLKAVLAIQRKLLGEDDPATLDTLNSLGKVLGSEGKLPEAEFVWREDLAAWRKRGGNENAETLYALRGLALTFEAEGKWSEAEALWRESLAAWRKKGGNEEQQSMYTLRKLGQTLEAESKWSEAESVHREALALSRKKGDTDPEALSDLERLVHVVVVEKRFGEAEQLLDGLLTPTVIRQPASANLLIQRVDLLGRQGRWHEASADAALALDLQPTDHYRYHTLVGLLAVTQNRPAYEQLVKRLFPKFATTSNPYVAERMAQDGLLMPQSGADLELLDKLADMSLALGSGDGNLPYFQAAKAMSNYRLGHFAEAVDWGDRATVSSTADASARAKADAVLAMAHWQLGQKETAREMLAKGDILAPRIASKPDNVDLGESWVAWLFARISLDEATALIQSDSKTGTKPDQP
jgi:serine/threonine protein kinase